MSNGVIEVDEVKIQMRTGEIERVNIGGTDIFGNPEVIRYTENGGKITALSGVMELDKREFEFYISYTKDPQVHLGRVSVEKLGRVQGELELRQRAFDILKNHYENHFVM